MSGDEEIRVPFGILHMMVVGKVFMRAERCINPKYPMIPDGAVEAVIDSILKRVNDDQLKNGEPHLNLLPPEVVEEKFIKEMAYMITCFEEMQRAEMEALRPKLPPKVPEFETLSETSDESVDTYFGLRDRDLEAEGEEIVITTQVDAKYRPTGPVDFTYLFRYLGPDSPMYKYEAMSKAGIRVEEPTEEPKTEDEENSAKNKKWSLKRIFSPLAFWKKGKKSTPEKA